MKTLLETEGRVEWWLYTVSHGQLLLRRPKSPTLPHRLDILFKDVREVHLPTFFDGLRIQQASDDDREVVISSPLADAHRYVLTGRNGIGYVVAGALFWVEDDREYNEPSSLLK